MSKKLVLGAAVLLAMVLSGPAMANETGNELYSECQGDASPAMRGFCLGYISGHADVLARTGVICFPEGVTNGQLRDMVMKNLTAVPEIRNLGAEYFVTYTLTNAFPCKGKSTVSQ